MDDLKNKISEDSNFFEEQELSNGHLDRFEAKLDELHPKKNILAVILKYAALFLLPVSILLVLQLDEEKQEKQNETVANQNQKDSSFPLAEAELYFKQTISSKQEGLALKYTDTESKAIVEEYQLLITDLEEQYLLLEKDLSISGDERIVVAMIKNYKTRIELLEELVIQLNYVNLLKQVNYDNPNA